MRWKEHTMSTATAAHHENTTRTILGVSVGLLACAIVLIVGLAVRPAGGLSLPTGYHVVHVDEFDAHFQADETTIPAGNVMFVDANRGTIPHEFVLFKTDQAARRLPLRADRGVDEDASSLEDVADSGSSLAPGETRLMTADLDPGHYALVCNLAGHYQAGMRLDITVR